MELLMYIGGKLIDRSTLSSDAMKDYRERDGYVRGAVNELLEKWEELIEDQNLKPEFCIQI